MECKYKAAGSVDEEDNVDPCTGFPTTHKAKLSFPSIVWNRTGQDRNTSVASVSSSDAVPNNRNEGNKRHHRFRWIGLFFTVCSALAFSLNALIAKLLNHLHPFNLGVWSFLLMTLFSGLYLIVYQVQVTANAEENIFRRVCLSLFRQESIPGTKYRLYLSLRSFGGVAALLLFFYSIQYLTVADALVIDASSPIFVYLMAFLFLNEKFGVVPVFTTIIAFCGVAFITRPPLLTHGADYNSESLIGVLFAFSGMLCIVSTMITLKILDSVPHAVVNFAFGLCGTCLCSLVSWICGVLDIPTASSDMMKIFGVAVLFYLGQTFITLALKYENAGPVGLLRTTELVFIFTWQFVFLGVVPDVYSLFGALLILVGVLLTLSRNWIASLPETDRLRQKCELLLL